MATKKKPIDWAGIERDYQKTDLSIRELARWYGLSEGMIRKKAGALKWFRPAGKGAQAGTQPPLRTEPAVSPPERVVTPVDSETTKPEAIVGRGRVLVLRMLDELDATTSHIGELEEQIEAAAPGKDNARQREALQKALSLSVRAGTLKNLALAMKTLAETTTTAPEGKKAQRQANAERSAGQGRFAVPEPPRIVQ